LDDGKILTGNPYIIFDGKNPWVSGVDFPNKTNPLIWGHGGFMNRINHH
jgi:hypothetical protein